MDGRLSKIRYYFLLARFHYPYRLSFPAHYRHSSLSLSFLSRDHPPLNAPTKARNTAFRGAAKGRRSGVVETMRARRSFLSFSLSSRVEFKFHSTEKRVPVLAIVFLSFSTKLYLTTKRIVFVVRKATLIMNVRNKRRGVNNRKALFCRVVERAFENSLTREGRRSTIRVFFHVEAEEGNFARNLIQLSLRLISPVVSNE